MSVPRRLPRAGDKPGKPTGRYQARIPVTRFGKTTQVSVGTFASKRDAIDCQNFELAKIRAGGFVDPADRKTSVREWAAEWMALRANPSRKVESFLSSRIVPRFGGLRLDQVEKIEIQRWINTLNAEGLASATVRGLYTTLRQMLDAAVEYDRLTKNPCRGHTLPKATDRDVVLLMVPDMLALEQAITPRFSALVHLGCWAGLRIGELAALRWTDIDLEAGLIVVASSRRHDGTVGPTKSGKSRTLDIGPATVDVLRAHRRDYGTSDLVFTTARQQRPLDANNFRSGPWAAAVQTARLDPAPGPHAMRHGYATRLAMAGVDWQIISEQLGHHSAAFSMSRYGTLRRPDKRKAVLAALVAGS